VDRDRRATGFGPHRDDPVLLLDGADSRYHASQGEQRTMALSLRLGLQRAIGELSGTPPLLLLDDVFSELDAARGKALAAGLLPSQTLITTAHPEDVPIVGRLWAVAAGTVS
jgi:DNA replication and repair protein RecF